MIYADFQALLIPNTTIDSAGNYTFGWQSFDRFVQLFVDAGALSYIYTPTLLEGAGPQVEILQNVGGSTQKVLVTPNSAVANAYLDKVFPALKAHLDTKGWTDIFYFSALDEPSSTAQVSAATWLYAKYAQYFPHPRTNEAHNTNMPDLDKILTTVTPTTEVYQNSVATYQKFRQTPGKELWLYTCIIPQGNYMNRFIRYHLDKTRLIPWLLWKIGASGYLHWGWNYWVNGSVAAGWTAADTFDGHQNGDAWLVRPNKPALDVYDSVRSEAQLDGIEDFELLTALARTKPVTAHAVANTLITDSTTYTRNGEDVVAAHRHLLDALTSPAGGTAAFRSPTVSRTSETGCTSRAPGRCPAVVTTRPIPRRTGVTRPPESARIRRLRRDRGRTDHRSEQQRRRHQLGRVGGAQRERVRYGHRIYGRPATKRRGFRLPFGGHPGQSAGARLHHRQPDPAESGRARIHPDGVCGTGCHPDPHGQRLRLCDRKCCSGHGWSERAVLRILGQSGGELRRRQGGDGHQHLHRRRVGADRGGERADRVG